VYINTYSSTVSAITLSLKLAQKGFSSGVCALCPCENVKCHKNTVVIMHSCNTLNAYTRIIMAIRVLTSGAQLDRKDPKLCRQSLTHNVGLVR